jgi:hypothetical protein
MREKLDRLEPARPVWEALSEGRVLLTPWLVAELRRFAADDTSAVEGVCMMLHEGLWRGRSSRWNAIAPRPRGARGVGMSSLVPPPPKHETPPLTKADVPRYVNAILGMAAVSQSMGVDDLLRFGIETSYTALERRINAAGLGAEAGRVAAQMRGEAGAVAPVVELRPHLVAQEEAAR